MVPPVLLHVLKLEDVLCYGSDFITLMSFSPQHDSVLAKFVSCPITHVCVLCAIQPVI